MKGLKYIIYIIGSILLLLGLLFVFTQTPVFRQIIKKQAVKFVNRKLDGQLSIGKIEGNLFNRIYIRDVSFSKSDSLILQLDNIGLHYNLKALLFKEIEVYNLILSSPHINTWQEADSTWNVQHIFPRRKRRRRFPFAVQAHYVKIEDCRIRSESLKRPKPLEISDLNLLVSGSYRSDTLRVKLKNLNLNTTNPTLAVKKINADFKLGKGVKVIDNLTLQTDKSVLQGEASLLSKEDINMAFSATINKEEFNRFSPQLKLKVSPEVDLTVNSGKDSVKVDVELINGKEKLQLHSTIQSLWKALNDKNQPAPYEADILFSEFTPENWIELSRIPATFNGSVEIKGAHILDYKMPLELKARLDGTTYDVYTFDNFYAETRLRNDNVNFNIMLNSAAGRLDASGYISGITTTPLYSITISGDSILPDLIMPELAGTYLNTNIEIKGSGISPTERQITAAISLYNSAVLNVPVDSTLIIGSLNGELAKLDTFNIKLQGGIIDGSGWYNLNSRQFEMEMNSGIDSLTFISFYKKPPFTFEKLTSQIRGSGSADSLKLEGKINGTHLEGYSVKGQTFDAEFNALLHNKSFSADASIIAVHLSAGDVRLDTIRSNIWFKEKQLIAELEADWIDTVHAKVRTEVQLSDTLNIGIRQLELKTPISYFYLPDSLSNIQLPGKAIRINHLEVKDSLNTDFQLIANGSFSLQNKEEFDLTIDNLNLSQLNKILAVPDSLGGLLSTRVDLSGSSASPVIKATIDIKEPRYGPFTLSEMESKVSLADEKFDAELSVPGIQKSLLATFSAPVKAYKDSTGFVIKPPESFEAYIKMDTLNISQPVSKYASNIQAEGILSVYIKASGSIDAPMIEGEIKLDQGKFADPKYGINYDNITARILMDGKSIKVDTLLVTSDDGFLEASGSLEYDSTIIKGNIIGSSLRVDADNFLALNHANYLVRIDASTFLKTGENKPEFGGEIEVLRSEFYVPAVVTSKAKSKTMSDAPLLVQATSLPVDTTVVTAKEKKKIKKQLLISEIKDNLSGRLNVDISRNTWLKSEDMKLEVYGDLEIVKESPYFELFGEVVIVRGHYILLGRKLNIEEGQIVFQGGETIDPNLNIRAKHVYRGTDKSKKELVVHITGLASEPVIRFTLDGYEIPEADGLSILLFGQTMDEMSFASQDGLMGSVSSNMVAQIISSSLSKTMGTKLKLDVIEVNATENWQSAAFVVGKYITNDLFVIYQRGFGESKENELTPETISLEYELNRFVFFRLQSGTSKTSGVDVILKFEQGERK